MTTPQPAALPELPEPDRTMWQHGKQIDHYTADQMDARYLRGYNDALAALQSQPAACAPTAHIKEPYTLAELNARIASNDYNAELLLQHAMLLLNAQPAAAGVSDEEAKYVEQIMEQAQVFASAWSLVGGRFDFGNALNDAYEAKDELRALVARAILALRPQAVPMTDADAVQVYGIKNGQQTLLGTAPMPSRMKARELAREQFGHFEDGDGSDAELCFYALEQLIEHMERSAHHGITAQGGEG